MTGHIVLRPRMRTRLGALLLMCIVAVSILGSATRSVAAVSETEVDRGVYMRDLYGLRADRAYVEELISSTRDVGSLEFGMPLTKAEADDLELNDRANFEAAVSVDLVPYLETLPTYAGEWIDQKDGGSLVVMLTKHQDQVIADIKSRMPKPSRGVRFEIVDSTWVELEEALERSPSVAKSIVPSARFSIGEINTQKNRLDLRFVEGAASLKADEASLEASLGVKVSVGSSPRTTQMENCGNGSGVENCWNPLRAGVRVYWRTYNDPWICTMGFHILKDGNPQWLTAGHCVYDKDTSNKMFHSQWFHNPGGDAPYEHIGEQKGSLYNETDKIDAARIGQQFGAAEASARIYGTAPTFFTGDAGSPVVGVKVWARGATSMLLGRGAIDGDIKSKSAMWYSETAKIMVKGATMGAFNPEKGDSGGPIYIKGEFNGTEVYTPIGIINDDVEPEDGIPGKCAFAKVVTVLGQFDASILTGSS